MLEFFVLVAVVLAGLVAAPVLFILGTVALVRSSGDAGPSGGLRGVALLSAGGAAAAYLWGALHLLGAVLTTDDSGTDAFPIQPCREGGMARAETVVDHSVSFLPLRFTCELRAGGGYTVAVPGYVNPAVGVLGLAAVACGILAGAAGERSGRKRSPAP
ncbi:hypothetical protein [Kitasatospora sp. NPDC004289]